MCVDDKSRKSSLLLVMTKKTMKISRILLNVGSVTMIIFDNDAKVRDHCHINGKYRGSAHRDFSYHIW